jgi:hypothetical protein
MEREGPDMTDNQRWGPRQKQVLLSAFVACGLLLGAATAGAAWGSKVEVTYGGGWVAEEGRGARITTNVAFTSIGASCWGVDDGGTIGKNPSGTLKVAGSGVDESLKYCENAHHQIANGGLMINRDQVSKSGKETLSLSATVEIESGCKYELSKATGSQPFGGAFEAALAGTAKLQKGVANPPGCAKTSAVEASLSVTDSGDFYYVNLIS